MHKFRGARYLPLHLTLVGAANLAAPTHAADYSGASFSTRLPAALARFSSYGDVAGFGGASAGSRYASSVNPAATDWQAQATGLRYTLSPQYSRLRFDTAPALNIATLSGSASVAGIGGVQAAWADIRQTGSEDGDFLLLGGHVAQAQWGRSVADGVAVGLTVSHARIDTRAGMSGMLLADGHSGSDTVRGGALWAATPRLLFGAVAEYSRSKADTALFDPACFCAMPLHERGRGRSLRVGVSYEYAELSSLYADYLHGSNQDPSGKLVSRVAFAGIEHRVLPWLYGRAGVARDLRGYTSPTLGIGLALGKNWAIDIAYQRDMFPELRPEFGRSRLINFSAGVSL